ncbi:GNAT family N-acetyltransferase [Nonomuraea sp. MTCD27]|uniref:GNAT family N-acetyltransferase n=1 Tax=Nonomuraea sp. MTCD27 TaxID=1676747 RepID=UPI0035C256A7
MDTTTPGNSPSLSQDAATDAAALAFRTGMAKIAESLAGAHFEIAPHGTLLAFNRAAVPALNPILSPSREPDAGEIAVLASKAAELSDGRPWSIRVRGEVVAAEIRETADKHHLTVASQQLLMTKGLTAEESVANLSPSVRLLAGAEFAVFGEIIGAAFGVPAEIVSQVYDGDVLGVPDIQAYVLEHDGTAVAAGVAVLADRHVAIGNVATLPDFRRRGHASLLTRHMLQVAARSGCIAAYLHAGDAPSIGLFQSLGFVPRETWTMLSAF